LRPHREGVGERRGRVLSPCPEGLGEKKGEKVWTALHIPHRRKKGGREEETRETFITFAKERKEVGAEKGRARKKASRSVLN